MAPSAPHCSSRIFSLPFPVLTTVSLQSRLWPGTTGRLPPPSDLKQICWPFPALPHTPAHNLACAAKCPQKHPDMAAEMGSPKCPSTTVPSADTQGTPRQPPHGRCLRESAGNPRQIWDRGHVFTWASQKALGIYGSYCWRKTRGSSL